LTAPGTPAAALRAPREDGAILAVPPLEQAPALLAVNRQRLARPDRSLLGVPLPRLQQQARQEVLQATRAFLEERGEEFGSASPDQPFLLAGHQPELFHPGVWIKNFALAGLARRLGGVPINLIIDSDTCKSTALRVPTRRPDSPWPVVESVPFDRPGIEVPFEERTIHDFEQFRDFPRAVQKRLAVWNLEPLLPGFWGEVLARVERFPTPRIGDCFAAARRALERRWGCHNLEVPISLVCQTPAFATFAVHLITHLESFQEIYNSSIADYRRRYGLHSRNHPVPELVIREGWLETPFWGWHADSPRRGRLFLKPHADRTEVRTDQEPWPDLPSRRHPEALREAWLDLQRQGWRLRSRALVTTLFARLLLGDLFLHGIGGGKYDELTDALFVRFLNVHAPAYLVLSGTLWLPLSAPSTTLEDRRRAALAVRDLHFNPQRHLAPALLADPAVRALVARKEEWINRSPDTSAGRRERFRVLQGLTGQLRSRVADQEQRELERLRTLDRELLARDLLHSREYAFCLFPEHLLRPFLTRVL
jgi:hypothetical protein